MFLRLFFRWVLEKVTSTKKPIIAFIGPDGAGKSTVSDHIESILKKNERVVARAYLGRGKEHILPINIPGRVVYRSLQKVRTNHHILTTLLYNLAAPLYTLDLLIRYWFTIHPKRFSKIVITDRYGTDVYLIPHVNKYIRRFLFHLFPKPDLTFYLYNDPRILYERKRQQSVEELQKQLLLFDEMADILAAHKIESDRLEVTLAKVAEIIFEYLARTGK